jgi:hypothetical protein
VKSLLIKFISSKEGKSTVALPVVSLLAMTGLYFYSYPSPSLKVVDQTIQNGQITVKQLNLPYDGWLLLYSTKYGQRTEIIGQTRVNRGRHKNVGVYVNVLRTTAQVEVAIFQDILSPGIFDKEQDRPAELNGKPLAVIFNKK